jgi:hypothetical protein
MSFKSRMIVASLLTTPFLLGASGCRIGNRIVKAADPTAMSGYYKTEPAAMAVCAFVAGKSPQCAAADTGSVPSSIQSVMTNPVYVSANTSSAKAYLVPNTLDTSSLFEVNLDPTGRIEATPYSDTPQQLWTDPACLSQVQIQKQGTIRPGTVTSTSSFKLSGTVDFSIGVLTVMGNQCAATFTLMASCYQDATQCPGATTQEQQADQQAVRDFLDPYLSRGALTLADLPALQGLGWQVDYQ